uniref:Uncharacterized protein n=1 Tax=Zonotrichia albicollis TaxID=44394 RepID=A0A8D2QG10_ZONAL
MVRGPRAGGPGRARRRALATMSQLGVTAWEDTNHVLNSSWGWSGHRAHIPPQTPCTFLPLVPGTSPPSSWAICSPEIPHPLPGGY